MTDVQFLYRAAINAGCPIAMINGDEFTWMDKKPSAAKLATIHLEAKRLEVAQTVMSRINAMSQSLVAKYPMAEQQGWPVKLQEAKAVQAGDLDEADAFQLGIEAGIAGVSVADLAASTIAAAALTGMIPAITAGLRQRLEAGIAAATNEDDLNVISAKAEQMREAIMTAFASGDPLAVKAAVDGMNAG